MLAFQQHISPHFVGQQHPESRLKRSMSPSELSTSFKRESFDYVRHMRRRSLSRSSSPVRSHSPTYISYLKAAAEQHLLKRSISEEDLRISHDRRRHSIENELDHHHQHHNHHGSQILMNYHSRQYEHTTEINPDAEDSDVEVGKNNEEITEEVDEDAPLDLSMGSKKRRGRTDSGTDSDDSTSLGDEGRGNEGRAYKKSLMKRYCKSQSFFFLLKSHTDSQYILNFTFKKEYIIHIDLISS